MMPARWLTSRSPVRGATLQVEWLAVLVATNFIVGRCTASAMASASRSRSSVPSNRAERTRAWHQPGIVPSLWSLRLR